MSAAPRPQRARRRSDGARGWFMPARDATFDYLPDGLFVTQEGALAGSSGAAAHEAALLSQLRGTPLPYWREELELE